MIQEERINFQNKKPKVYKKISREPISAAVTDSKPSNPNVYNYRSQ